MLLTSDVECHWVADAVALDVVRHAGVDARGVPLDVLQHQRLVRYDHPRSHVVNQRVLLPKKFHHDDGDDGDNVEDEKEEERDGLVICVFWKRPLAFLAIGELPLQQSQL